MILSIPKTLRRSLTAQTTFLAAFWAFLAVPVLSLIGLITFALPAQVAPNYADTLYWMYAASEHGVNFFAVGFASIVVSWFLLLLLVPCQILLQTTRWDGILPMAFCGAALSIGLYSLLSSQVQDTIADGFFLLSANFHTLFWGGLYGATYGLFLIWLLKRAAKGTLHSLT